MDYTTDLSLSPASSICSILATTTTRRYQSTTAACASIVDKTRISAWYFPCRRSSPSSSSSSSPDQPPLHNPRHQLASPRLEPLSSSSSSSPPTTYRRLVSLSLIAQYLASRTQSRASGPFVARSPPLAAGLIYRQEGSQQHRRGTSTSCGDHRRASRVQSSLACSAPAPALAPAAAAYRHAK